ncbi:MAG TPA: RHS repeat-associated core domain-containing protein, partial [Micromonosporaceae bacterium]|nr:RHS repeat-associated core domain-containing protein [Micromonosporaceae bacterium]
PGVDAVTDIPPVGGTITTTYTDARGNTTAIDQYHSTTAPSGAFDATTYAFTPTGQLSTVTDNAGNVWSDTYDLLGRQISATGPDTGTTTSTYDDLGQLTSATGANGKTLSFVYDKDGRKTAEYDTTGGAAETAADQLGAWTYDSPAVGQPSTSTSFFGGTAGEAYKQTVNSYDPGYQPTSVTYNVPSNALTGSLAGSYTFTSTYNPDGSLSSQSFPAAGGLPAETVFAGYDNLGSPYSLFSGLSDYVEQSFYAPDGKPAEIDLGTSQSAQWSRTLYSYDAGTGRLNRSQVQRESANWANATNVGYGFDNFGNATSISDSVAGDTQCLTYDYDQRLVAGWAQASASCPATPPGAAGIGGPAPYQQTFSYDGTGLGKITANNLVTPSSSTSTTLTYPAAGAATPHAATTLMATVGGTTTTTNQTWTASGQLATSATGGTTLTYHWNDTGQLGSVSNGSTTTTAYRYDADGNQLLRQDGSTTTLYLPGEELDATGGTVTATRYYSHGDQEIAARTPGGLTWLVPDPQGTDNAEIDTSNQAVTQRRDLPFGAPRGAAPPSWPGDRGFVGGTTDTATGLTNLGAREYNPAGGTFISPDTLIAPYVPQDLDPYAYGADNPTTNTDPSGQMFIAGSGCIGGCGAPAPAPSRPRGGGGYRPPPPLVNWYVPPPILFWPTAPPPPKPKPVKRPVKPVPPPARPACNSRIGALNGDCVPPPMPKSGPAPKWLLWGGLVALTVINVVQLGADPATDGAEAADAAALVADTAADDAGAADAAAASEPPPPAEPPARPQIDIAKLKRDLGYKGPYDEGVTARTETPDEWVPPRFQGPPIDG